MVESSSTIKILGFITGAFLPSGLTLSKARTVKLIDVRTLETKRMRYLHGFLRVD